MKRVGQALGHKMRTVFMCLASVLFSTTAGMAQEDLDACGINNLPEELWSHEHPNVRLAFDVPEHALQFQGADVSIGLQPTAVTSHGRASMATFPGQVAIDPKVVEAVSEGRLNLFGLIATVIPVGDQDAPASLQSFVNANEVIFLGVTVTNQTAEFLTTSCRLLAGPEESMFLEFQVSAARSCLALGVNSTFCDTEIQRANGAPAVTADAGSQTSGTAFPAGVGTGDTGLSHTATPTTGEGTQDTQALQDGVEAIVLDVAEGDEGSALEESTQDETSSAPVESPAPVPRPIPEPVEYTWNFDTLNLFVRLASRTESGPTSAPLRNACSFSLALAPAKGQEVPFPLSFEKAEGSRFFLHYNLETIPNAFREILDPHASSLADGVSPGTAQLRVSGAACALDGLVMALPQTDATDRVLSGNVLLPAIDPDVTILHNLSGLTTLAGDSAQNAEDTANRAVRDFAQYAHEKIRAHGTKPFASAQAYVLSRPLTDAGYATDLTSLAEATDTGAVAGSVTTSLPIFDNGVRALVSQAMESTTGTIARRDVEAVLPLAPRPTPDELNASEFGGVVDVLIMIETAADATAACRPEEKLRGALNADGGNRVLWRIVGVAKNASDFREGQVNSSDLGAWIWACNPANAGGGDVTVDHQVRTFVVSLADIQVNRSWGELQKQLGRLAQKFW